MKCEKCDYVSFDFNLTCPACNKDLQAARTKLGVFYRPPDMELDQFFTGGSGTVQAGFQVETEPEVEVDLETESFADEVEFSLDD